ncbi:ABC transporter substrate-binding protein [Streptomyces sclerotialus]|uniref:ABC transporter substrate-binding protein n=1 Tax=Streptomyces sclerotialus TaxID=1957 RepID=UPI0018CB26D2
MTGMTHEDGSTASRGGVPALPGVDSFVKAFDRLVLQERRDRGRVPVVLLLEPGTGTAGRRIVAGLGSRLRGQDRVLTSHAHVEAGAPAGVPLALFDDIVNQLTVTMPPGTGKLRLPRYRLMRAVVSAPPFEGDPAHRESRLRRYCYNEHRQGSRLAAGLWFLGGRGDQGGSAFSMIWNFFAGPLFQGLPRLLYGRRAARLMLGRPRRPRWHAQWYRAQHGSWPTDFFHSATGLAGGGRYRDEVTLDRVLLHALLADLDAACRSRPLHPWLRRRRTRFVLLFAESGSQDSREQRFLRELRSAAEHLRCTSVLVVAAGVRSVAGRIPDIEAAGLAEAGLRLAEIAEADRESGEPTGVVVPVTETPEDDERARYWLDQNPALLPPVPGFGPRTEVAACAGALLLACAVVLTAVSGVPFTRDPEDRCRDQMFLGADGTCVGVDTGAKGLGNGPSEQALKAVLRQIERQNGAVEKAAEEGGPAGPAPVPRYRTVVYFGALSGGKGAEDAVRGGTLPALRGIALAQRDVNAEADSGEDVPLRVIAADAGDRYKDAEAVARRIADLAQHGDPSIVGVVGFVQSRHSTFKAVEILDRAGIPMVGTSGTADALVAQGRHYYQLAPVDDRGARAMAGFAAEADFVRTASGVRTAKRAVLVYDEADPYSAGLGTSFRTYYGSGRTDVLTYTPRDAPEPTTGAAAAGARRQDSLHALAGQVCDAVREEPRTALVWTARGAQFTQFLRAFDEQATSCPRLSVLGGDDVTNALIQQDHPWQLFPGLDLYYLSSASAPLLKENAEARTFTAAYVREYRHDTAALNKALVHDGHAAVAWDALHYLAKGVDAAWQATGEQRDGALGRSAVQTALFQGVGGYDGATGRVDAIGRHGRLTPDKLVFVLRGHPGGSPTPELVCGTVNAHEQRRHWGPGGAHRCPD